MSLFQNSADDHNSKRFASERSQSVTASFQRGRLRAALVFDVMVGSISLPARIYSHCVRLCQKEIRDMTSTTSDQRYDISQWYDSRPAKIGWLSMVGIIIFWLLYQRVHGYSHGLDSMTPEFESVWVGLWRFNILANASFFAVAIGWIWMTRDRNLADLNPKLELKRYFYWMGWLACYMLGVYFAGSLTLEQDAAWHQVIIRDTSFTASHIVAFYGTFPLYITCAVASYLYAQ